MTQNTAIICETNPFHTGHGSLFDRVRAEKAGIVTAVMSGNFVQRGFPAVLDKYKRAAVLLSAGADLVVELPYPWCASGGENFAAGGIAIAAGMGADTLAFGSETGDLSALEAWAGYTASPEYRTAAMEAEGASPRTGAAALHDRLTKEAGFTLSPNDKLALWYLQQIREQKAAVTPLPMLRLPYGTAVTSATELRRRIADGEDLSAFVPPFAAEIYRTARFTSPDRFYDLAWQYFRLFAPETPPAHGEKSGLYERLVKTARQTGGSTAFFREAATKKYTDARIRRTALFAMTDTPLLSAGTLPLYTILLGANERGRAYLKERRKTAGFPVLTKPADRNKLPPEAAVQYLWQERADRLYTMCTDPPEDSDRFLRESPVIL